MIKQCIIQNPEAFKNIQIIHQAGAQDTTDWNSFYKKHKIDAVTFDFSKTLHTYFSIADLVVCRSGAGSLFETAFFKKPCITIPLETKQNSHQVLNAVEMQKLYPKFFTVIRQNELQMQPKKLFDAIREWAR